MTEEIKQIISKNNGLLRENQKQRVLQLLNGMKSIYKRQERECLYSSTYCIVKHFIITSQNGQKTDVLFYIGINNNFVIISFE